MKRILFNKRFVVDPTNRERRRESRVSSIEKSGSLKLAIFKVNPAIGFGIGKVTGPFSCKTTFSSMRLDLVLLNRTGGIRAAFQASESFQNETPYYIAKILRTSKLATNSQKEPKMSERDVTHAVLTKYMYLNVWHLYGHAL